MAKIIAIKVAKEKAIAKTFTQNASSVEEVNRRIDEFYNTIAEFTKELEKEE